ncbi:hypothetical protein OUHCRE2_07890 [Enterobacter asburiae]
MGNVHGLSSGWCDKEDSQPSQLTLWVKGRLPMESGQVKQPVFRQIVYQPGTAPPLKIVSAAFATSGD